MKITTRPRNFDMAVFGELAIAVQKLQTKPATRNLTGLTGSSLDWPNSGSPPKKPALKIITGRRNSGHIFFVFVLLIAIVAIIWVGYKIIDHLQRHPPDPWHGQDTNDITSIDIPFSPTMAMLRSNLPAGSMVEVTLPEFKNAKVIVPLESLAHKWYWRVDKSSNMLDWVETDLDWEQACAINRTNHAGQQGYFRKVLIW